MAEDHVQEDPAFIQPGIQRRPHHRPDLAGRIERSMTYMEMGAGLRVPPDQLSGLLAKLSALGGVFDYFRW